MSKEHFRLIHFLDRTVGETCVMPTGQAIGLLCSPMITSEMQFVYGDRLADRVPHCYGKAGDLPKEGITKRVVFLLQGRLGDLLLQRGALQYVQRKFPKRRIEVVAPVYGIDLFNDRWRTLTYPVRLSELEDAYVVCCSHDLEWNFQVPALLSIAEAWGLPDIEQPSYAPREWSVSNWGLGFAGKRQVKDSMGTLFTVKWDAELPLVIMPMCANESRRSLPPEKIVQLAALLSAGARVALTCAPDEINRLFNDAQGHAPAWVEMVGDLENVEFFAGTTPLISENMAQLRHADMVVSADTFAYHAAQAMRVPATGIFAPTAGALRTWGSGFTKIVQLAAPCAPCWEYPCESQMLVSKHCLALELANVEEIAKEVLACLRH